MLVARKHAVTVQKDDEGMSSEERAFAKAVMGAVEKIKSATVRQEIIDALERGDYRAAVNAIRWSEGEAFLQATLPQQIRTIFENGGHMAIQEMRANVSFDILNRRAIDFIRLRTGELIQEWGDSSRDAVAAIIERLFDEGIAPARGARMIIDSGIGLTRRMATAVDNLRRRLEADGVMAGKADARAARKAMTLLRARGNAIARTEVMRAQNEGQQEAWRQAVDRGLLDPLHTFQVWLATNDRRPGGGTCEECELMNGQAVLLGQPFRLPDGSTITSPPLHPSCRCTLYTRVT